MYQCKILYPQPVSDSVDRKYSVDQGCGRSYRDQCIHIWRSVKQSRKPFRIIRFVNKCHRKAEEKLCKCKTDSIFRSLQKTRQRQADHMPHGHIHQRNQENKRENQPPFHIFHLLFHRIGFRRLCRTGNRTRNCLRAVCFYAGSVSGMNDCINNLLIGKRLFLVFHLHAVCQQIYTDILHTVQPADTFLHPGRTGRTGHSCHIKFLYHNCSFLTLPGCAYLQPAPILSSGSIRLYHIYPHGVSYLQSYHSTGRNNCKG